MVEQLQRGTRSMNDEWYCKANATKIINIVLSRVSRYQTNGLYKSDSIGFTADLKKLPRDFTF